MILDSINDTNDIKNIDKEDYDDLCREIREFLLEKVSKTGGHLASNLGVVELTIALHLFLDLPKDKLIFDVGHQCYTHKILTGRKDGFDTLRQYNGLSGFPKRYESETDFFDAGHSSNSISVALGYAKAREILNTDERIVAVIGDGALSGGIAYEALNNISSLDKNIIIVLNDNNMSISEPVGGISMHLSRLRSGVFYQELKKTVTDSLEKIPGVGQHLINTIHKTKNGIKQLVIPGMIFEEMGIKYFGPVDGHDINEMVSVFKNAEKVDGPVVVHVMTEKGKGYIHAENNPSRFHGIGAFDIETGKSPKKKPSYTDAFSQSIVSLADKNEDIVAITAAMADGTGLVKFKNTYPNRFFDIGIAEQHAVSFAAGLALAGLHPVVCIYSSFLQRGFDEVVQDVCLQDIPVIFAIDRAGMVGNDGPTHHGVFDIAYLRSIPNIVIMAPKNMYELRDMLYFANEYNHPIAIRYPRGEAYQELKAIRTPIVLGKAEYIHKNNGIAILAIGNMVKVAHEVHDRLADEGINITVVNMRFVKPLDGDVIKEVCSNHKHIVTLEDHSIIGGLGSAVSEFILDNNIKVDTFKSIGVNDEFIEQGSIPVLHKQCGMDCDSVYDVIRNYVE